MKAIIAISLTAAALAGCTQVTDLTRATLHPQIDRYCTEVTPELRQATRLSLGTTDEGNRLLVECRVDDPKAPGV